MRSGFRWAAAGMVALFVGVFVWLSWPAGNAPTSKQRVVEQRTPAVAQAIRQQSVTASVASPRPLVVPGVQIFTGGEQATDEQHLRRVSPEAIELRQRSRIAYAHATPAMAARVAQTSFPSVVDQPSGGMPELPAGARLVGFATPHAAQLALPGGKHAILESLGPIAKQTGSDHYTPIDLSLTATGRGYAPSSPDVAVQIPRQLTAGVQATETGISLTPVDAKGRALSGSEGTLDGASVLYANAQVDTDMVAKPTVSGFQLDALLRSAESPEQLYFKVGMPTGASLVQDPRTGVVSVQQGSTVLATIPSPAANDATQAAVPVSTSVSGNVLAVSVAHRSGSFQYPVELDPEIKTLEDRRVGELYSGSSTPTNWKFLSVPSGAFYLKGGAAGETLTDENVGSYEMGQGATFSYETQKESKIYEVLVESSGSDLGGDVEAYVEVTPRPQLPKWTKVNENYAATWGGSCEKSIPHNPECEGAKVETTKNAAVFGQAAYGKGAGFENTMLKAHVLIAQEASPTVGFNTSRATLANGQSNVFYGSGGWLGPNGKSFELEGTDPGIGISHFEINTSTRSWSYARNPLTEKLCSGVQCPMTLTEMSEHKEGQIFSYNKSWPDGEDVLEAAVENPMAMWSSLLKGTIKVDSTDPYGLKITSGLAESGAEISAAPHQITVEAKDGTKPTPSSGIKSIALSVDGKEIGSPAGSCPLGECSATGTWTINAEALGAGEHKLIITATDNAGNVTTKVVTFAVRNATPVTLGPGSVDPTTGQYALTSTDVAISGAGSLSRTYLSRAPSTAVGPLGPQWNLSLGTGEMLKLLPNGSAELTGASAGLTTFASNGSGGFTAPKGDGNLTLESKEKTPGKGITEYILKDPAAGTSTTFTQPTNSKYMVPTYNNQYGTTGAGTDQLSNPSSVATDAKNDVWVADTRNNRLDEFNEKGEFLAGLGWGVANGKEELEVCTTVCQAGILGAGTGQLNKPEGVAVDSKGNIWAADTGNSRIEEFNEKREFVAALGFGVRDEKEEFEVCTSSCKFGRQGFGHGEFDVPRAIAADGSGNVWVLDSWADRVQKFNEKHEYVSTFGTAGTGAGQFVQPTGLAIDPAGNVWVVDKYNNRVEEFKAGGEFVIAFGWDVNSGGKSGYEECETSCVAGTAGSGQGQFTMPVSAAIDANGDVWISDPSNKRVEEFSFTKHYIAQFVTNGGGGLAMDEQGNMWLSGGTSGVIEKWNHPLWFATRTEGAGGTDISTEAYRSIMSEEKVLTEPTQEVGPVATGVSCEPTLERGCRALTFSYDEETTATGESKSQWGKYLNRLKEVSFVGYNPTGKLMEAIPVARYEYDNHGRLRAEWDPRISPALKTTYGYDSEGHVTALTPPGEESWAFTYGTTSGDSSTGRLLKVTRPSASTKVWGGELPKNTEVPKGSGSTIVGTTMGVSKGVWSNEPSVYNYQWQDCNSAGAECVSILGATNENYTIVPGDAGHTLVVRVSATNGGGTVTQASAASAVVLNTGTRVEGTHYSPEPGSTVEYKVPVSGTGAPYAMGTSEIASWGQTEDKPKEATAIFPPDEAMGWPATSYKRATVYYRDEHARTTNVAAPSGGISTVEYNPTNEVTRELSADNRATALKEGSKSAEAAKALSTENIYYEETQLIKALGPEHKVKLANGSEVEVRHHEEFAYNEGAPGGETHNLVTKENAWSETSAKETLALKEVINSYSGQSNLGWELRKPTAVTTEAAGHKVTQTTSYERATGEPHETTSPQSEYTPYAYEKIFGASGNKEGQFTHPMDDAIDASGNVWVADGYNSRVEEFSSSGTFIASYGKEGTNETVETEVQFKEPVGIAINKTTGDIYVADQNNNRIVEFGESTGKIVRVFGKLGTGHGEFKEPNGVAVDAKGHVWVTDYGNNRVEQFGEEGKYLSEFGSGGKEAGKFAGPADLAISGEDIYVTDLENARVEEFNGEGKNFLRVIGSSGSGNGQFTAPSGIAIGAGGNLLVADSGNSRVEGFSPTGTFLFSIGTSGSGNGQMATPEGIAVAVSGQAYVTEAGSNNRVQIWAPKTGAGTTQTFYYSAKAESEVTACQNHPEWANLVCETKPAKQPETSGLPQLPVTITTYNIWDSPETVTQKISSKTGTTERVTTHGYDGAGRETSSEVTASAGTAVPAVKNEYSTETGTLVKQSATIKGEAKTITSGYNTLGQLTSYTDADGATTKYLYDIDGRVEEVRDAKGWQLYAYDPTTGDLTKLLDSSVGTFTATYDVAGKILTEGYPNGMTAYYSRNAIEQTTGLEYVKTTSCTEKCLLYKDANTYSINEELISQVSTLSTENYTYDEEGHLTKTQEIPVGKGCVTRLYSYDEESNRASLTTREPNSKGECATEGGAVVQHCYDALGRLCDQGVNYDEFGDMTKVPAVDAGGSELTTGFYVDGQVASQEQKGVTVTYGYDPAGRTRETVTGGKTAISHYDGPGEALAWSEGATPTRYIPGIDGALDAIETGGIAVLEIHNLEGDIVGTTGVSAEAEIKLGSPYESTEFGAPTGTAPKYGWLGAEGVTSEFGASGVATQGGASYVPQLAMELQTAPVEPPGARPNGSYSGTPYVTSLSPELAQEIADRDAEAPARQAEREQARYEEILKDCEIGEAACPGVDPPHIKYFSQARTKELVEKLESNGGVSDGIVDIINTFLDLDVEGEIASTVTDLLAEQLERDLGDCAAELSSFGSHSGCRLIVYTVALHFLDPFTAKEEFIEFFYGKFSVTPCSKLSGTKVFLCDEGQKRGLFL